MSTSSPGVSSMTKPTAGRSGTRCKTSTLTHTTTLPTSSTRPPSHPLLQPSGSTSTAAGATNSTRSATADNTASAGNTTTSTGHLARGSSISGDARSAKDDTAIPASSGTSSISTDRAVVRGRVCWVTSSPMSPWRRSRRDGRRHGSKDNHDILFTKLDMTCVTTGLGYGLVGANIFLVGWGPWAGGRSFRVGILDHYYIYPHLVFGYTAIYNLSIRYIPTYLSIE